MPTLNRNAVRSLLLAALLAEPVLAQTEPPADTIFVGQVVTIKLADLVMLSGNPLATDPERLLELRVVETISHGQSVFRAP